MHRKTLVLAAALLVGCSQLGIPGSRQAGIIESPYLHQAALAAPDSVNAGTPFEVTVTTLGFSGCWREDGAEVVAEAAAVVIRPYDRVRETTCTQMLVQLPRSVRLRFDQPGTAMVRLQGLSDAGGGAHAVELTRTVVVR